MGSLLLKLVILYWAYRRGIGFANPDEVSRLVFARNFIDTGDISSFEYFWLPLPFMLVGWLATLIRGEYYFATLLLNSFCCLGAYLFQMKSLHCVAESSSAKAESPNRSALFPLVVAGLVGLTTPWQTIGSLTGFSEPLSWFGLSGATMALLMFVRRPSRHVMPLIMGLFLGISSFTRYEAWFSCLFMLGLLVFYTLRSVVPSARPRVKVILALTCTAGAVLALMPIVYWCTLNARIYGDPIRMLEFTHRFETDLAGRSRHLGTVFQFISECIGSNPLLVPLVVIACLKRRWDYEYAILLFVPLLSLLAMMASVARSGIPWMTGERTLGFYSMAFVAPGILVLEERWRAAPPLLYRALAVCTLLLLVSVNLGSLLFVPIPTSFPREHMTRPVVAAAALDRSGKGPLRIAVPGTSVWESTGYLMWPWGRDLVTIPGDWLGMSAEARLAWIREKGISILAVPFEEPEAVRAVARRSYLPPDLATAVKEIESRKDSVAICTHGSLPFLPGTPLLELLAKRGGQGPRLGQWVRYLGVFSRKSMISEASINDADIAPNPTLYIHARPLCNRQGLPGAYTLRLEPANYGASTVIQLSSSVFQPKIGGYYILAFDANTGVIHDTFCLRDGGAYVYRGDDIPFFVYLFD